MNRTDQTSLLGKIELKLFKKSATCHRNSPNLSQLTVEGLQV